MSSIRLQIYTRDRIGMALDILRILYQYDANLKALEVSPGLVCIKIDSSLRIPLSDLVTQLQAEEDVLEVKKVELLPHERRERHIKAVLDAAGEGIIAIDDKGIITTFNPAAEKILKIKAKDAVGKNIADLISPDIPMLQTIVTGESYDNEEMIINTEKLKSHYITSGRPILDEEGKPIGAVASLKDIESVMELIHDFTQTPMITFDEILGKSEAITKAKELAMMVAKSDSTVLIRGESGTGKELFARSIHMASPRKDKPFVAVNCAALPDALLESELFGYEEGAFTGAKKGGKQGLFRYADKGTLFLDEIGELSAHLQVKLLRVLQENKIRQVGANEEIPVDVRIIAATNRNLEELMKNGQFRDDLYYRLNVIPLVIPPLRERKEDIPILVHAFIKKISYKMGKKVEGISDEAMELLIKYEWPGNIRELSNVIERAINLCDDRIESQHLLFRYDDLKSTAVVNSKSQRTLKDIVAETEKIAIVEALKQHKSIRKAAKALGVTHATVINKIKQYGINHEEL